MPDSIWLYVSFFVYLTIIFYIYLEFISENTFLTYTPIFWKYICHMHSSQGKTWVTHTFSSYRLWKLGLNECDVSWRKVPLWWSQFSICSNFCEKSWKLTISRFRLVKENTIFVQMPLTKFVCRSSFLSYKWKYETKIFFPLFIQLSYYAVFSITGPTLWSNFQIWIFVEAFYFLQNSLRYGL